MIAEWKERNCDVCGKPFTKKEWEDRHDFHEPDCKRRRIIARNIWEGHCLCDLIAHDGCCPTCHPESEYAKANGYKKQRGIKVGN